MENNFNSLEEKQNSLVEVEYEQLSITDGKINDIKKIRTLLTICIEGRVIYLCHPNHIFNHYEEGKTKEIVSVDWNDINVERMFQVNDYGRYSYVEQFCSNGKYNTRYLQKKSSHMMKKYYEQGKVDLVYPFVVLEDMGYNRYFVRGMICCNQDGYQVAFNPKMYKQLPNESVWEKGLRIGDNY